MKNVKFGMKVVKNGNKYSFMRARARVSNTVCKITQNC